MPNLQPPVVDVEQALAYRARIMKHASSSSSSSVSSSSSFTPLMTLYLTLATRVEDIEAIARDAAGHVVACKLYPAGATTHSNQGIPLSLESLQTLAPVLQAMTRHRVILCIHSEVTDATVDIFDRESAFLTQFMPILIAAHPELKIVLEHITTEEAVKFVEAASANVAATITAHHLLANRNAIFQGGLNPHYYCLPVLKSEQHRRAILAAATSSNQRFFAGTDSAPHSLHRKLHEGCAGCYTAYAPLELYAESFASVDALSHLEEFCSLRGRKFYNLDKADNAARSRVTLVRVEEGWQVPASLPFGPDQVVPFMANKFCIGKSNERILLAKRHSH